ncbi:MAG: peptidoglycan-associated lipoprotein Pal [Deltaproteobacteria bacterium]
MKQWKMVLLVALGTAALLAAGCASNETVKKEEPVAATVKAEPAPEPVKEAPKAEPKAEEQKPVEAMAAKASAAGNAFESVYFDFDKADLRQDARSVLDKNAEALKAKSDVKIKIEGNCDARGSAEYNLALGERRAKSAMKYLTTLGVAADRISTISYGKEKAKADGNDESVWSKDRRDDFVVVK